MSWKKNLVTSYRAFTIGVSLIGGGDSIASEGSVISDFNNYYYFDESPRVIWMDYERELNMPVGGLTKALADVVLDNTSRRYTPRFMGGNSELYTSILTRRPIIINAGFDHDGILDLIPQFVGILTKTPKVDRTSGQAKLKAADFVDYLQNKYLDTELMFTGQRIDQILETSLQSLGFATSQYDLDLGINPIPFGLFEPGTKLADMFHELAIAENGHIYQDETGIIRYENRQHWDSAPYTEVQATLFSSQVLEAELHDDDHIINVVEVRSPIYEKKPEEIIFSLTGGSESTRIPAGGSKDVFFQFSDPALSMTVPSPTTGASHYLANTSADGTGTDVTSNISIASSYKFATSGRVTFSNPTGQDVFVTELIITGRLAKHTRNIYTRVQDNASVTAYEERVFTLDSKYIQNESWANSYAQMILNDFAQPENLQNIKIRAMPQLSMGDLISWQGRHWRIFGIKTTMSADVGFVQELTLLQRTVNSYFRIGISTIGEGDKIAP